MSDPGSVLGRTGTRRAAGGDVRPEPLGPLLATLVELAGAATVDHVATAAVRGAAEVAMARAAALGVQRGDSVVVLASVGYDCDAMAAAAVLPLDAGLPITECARTGRTIVRGQAGAPMWVAVPVVTAAVRGALLVSLSPASQADAGSLELIADATSAALARTDGVSRATRVGNSGELPGWLDVAAVVKPAPGGETVGSGDVVAVLPGATADVSWLVAGDVCGSGIGAAELASELAGAAAVLAGADVSPAALLTGVDRSLRRHMRADRHATAVAIRLRHVGDRAHVAVACAGHPPVLHWRRGQVTSLGSPALPLNLLAEDATSYDDDAVVELLPGDLLLAYTDGLVEHGTEDRTDLLVEVFARAGALRDASAVSEVVHRAMTIGAGVTRDDAALAVIALAQLT